MFTASQTEMLSLIILLKCSLIKSYGKSKSTTSQNYRIFAYIRHVLYKVLRTPHPGCILYMGASYAKYFLNKSSKPVSYIWARLIIRCVLYARKYGKYFLTRTNGTVCDIEGRLLRSIFTFHDFHS